jgi:hypothetical protein
LRISPPLVWVFFEPTTVVAKLTGSKNRTEITGSKLKKLKPNIRFLIRFQISTNRISLG